MADTKVSLQSYCFVHAFVWHLGHYLHLVAWLRVEIPNDIWYHVDWYIFITSMCILLNTDWMAKDTFQWVFSSFNLVAAFYNVMWGCIGKLDFLLHLFMLKYWFINILWNGPTGLLCAKCEDDFLVIESENTFIEE